MKELPDTVIVIYEYLTLPGTRLHDLVEDRIWGRGFPSATVWNNEKPAIVFQSTTERVQDDSYFKCTVRFRCFGGSMLDSDARDVYLALIEHFQNAFSQDGIMYANQQSANPDLVEPDSGYPVCILVFECGIA